MDREIKFRAWNGSSMQYGGFGVHSTGKVVGTPGLWFGDIDINKPIIMQYTGLKDSKGRDIYEGDILSTPNFTDYRGKVHSLIHVVEWSDKYSGWFVKAIGDKTEDLSDGSIQIFVYMRNTGEVDVIGNKFENTEILESE